MIKTITRNICLFLSLPFAAGAQDTAFHTTEYLDVNRFNAAHMVHGDMWYKLRYMPGPFIEVAVEYPKGTGKHVSFGAMLWMSGIDDDGKLHVAAQRIREDVKSLDYWPGPLDAADTLTYATSAAWARIWKINRSDISAFLSLPTRTVTTVPAIILEWPAKGNPYAKGNAGVSLSITKDMAPFVDKDGDGSYDPLKGDYPDMKGDQMLWWVFSDNGATHNISKSAALKIECHMMAYAYNRGTKADQIMFYEYKLHNRSALRYHDFRVAIFSEADLGYPFDDYIGFDSTHRMGVQHNAALPDITYGNHVPMTGLSFLEIPGDHYPALQPAGSFVYFDNVVSGPLKDPSTDLSYNNYIRGKMFAGTPFVYSDKGLTHYGSFVYPLPDSSECAFNNTLRDRRFVLSSADYTFEPGASTKLGMAFMATDTVGYACPISTFKPLNDLADTALEIYYHPLPLSQQDPYPATQGVRIYPNPATNRLYVEVTGTNANYTMQFHVYDVTGRKLQLSFAANGNTFSADISSLAPGVYSLSYDDGDSHHAQTFVKR